MTYDDTKDVHLIGEHVLETGEASGTIDNESLALTMVL